MFHHSPEGGALKLVPRNSELQNAMLGINRELTTKRRGGVSNSHQNLFIGSQNGAIFPLYKFFFAKTAETK